MTIDMRDVVIANALPLIHETSTSADTICPICGKRKLHFNFKENVFNCPACGEARGGILDAWALFRNINGINKKDLYRNVKIDIEEFFDSGDINNRIIQAKKRNEEHLAEIKEEDLAPLAARDYTYKMLLKELRLSDSHRQSLRNRGFSDEEIDYFDFRTMPNANLIGISSNLLAKGCTLKGVPGFYMENGKSTFVRYGSGILIPEKNCKGEISQCQVRLDNGPIKYLTLSSGNKEGGVKGKAVCHFAGKYGKEREKIERIIFTEGPIKANFAYARLGIPVISVPGVTSTKHFKAILPELKKAGLKKMSIAYDMDSYSNPHVHKALLKVEDFLYESDVDFEILTWDPRFKGIDDYLKHVMH